MTDKQMRDEAMTLFLAGHETTAVLTLSWCWYLLARHPDAEQKLLAEVDRVLAGRKADCRRLAQPQIRRIGRPRIDAALSPRLPHRPGGDRRLHHRRISGAAGHDGADAAMGGAAGRAFSTIRSPFARSGAWGEERIKSRCRSSPTSHSAAGRECASASSSR